MRALKTAAVVVCFWSVIGLLVLLARLVIQFPWVGTMLMFLTISALVASFVWPLSKRGTQ
jgi:hypothetical protein